MPCYKPLTAYRSRVLSEKTGRPGITFNKAESSGVKVQVPCGQCIGCRLQKTSAWAVRCMHEAKLHDENCFVTLTYSPEHLPYDGSLHHKHFQAFMKSLRKRLRPKRIRFFMCGEYGKKLSRPHYHAIIFGWFPEDAILWQRNATGDNLYRSALLEKCWQRGFSSVGALTMESASYVARYTLKKVTGSAAEEHYQNVDVITGEIHKLKPEYTSMSTKPGIGNKFIEKYETDVFPRDYVVMRGRKYAVPAYYRKWLEKNDPELAEALKRKRQEKANERGLTDDDLDRIQTCKEHNYANQQRGYEK